MADKQWFTGKEAAEHLGISHSQFSRLANAGHFPVSYVPGLKDSWRVSREKLDELMRDNEQFIPDRPHKGRGRPAGKVAQ